MSVPFYFYFGSYAHPFYRAMATRPPAGYRVLLSDGSVTARNNMRHVASGAGGWWCRRAVGAVKAAGYPKLVRVRIPAEARFVHAAQHLLMSRTPWVTDFEDATAYAWFSNRTLYHPIMQRSLRRILSGASCRRVLPWTEAARQSLLRSLPAGPWHGKVETLYPAYDTEGVAVPRRGGRGPVRLLFVGRHFNRKGGPETIEAFRVLRQRHAVELTMVTRLDEAARRRYGGEPGVRFLWQIAQAELERAYREADIFVMPTHFDTFGLVYLEAMAWGLPCVGTRQFSVPEIIEEGQTGLLVRNHVSRFDAQHRPIARMTESALRERSRHPPAWAVEELARALGRLVADRAHRERLGRAGRERVETGRFSVRARQRRAEAIYGEVVSGVVG